MKRRITTVMAGSIIVAGFAAGGASGATAADNDPDDNATARAAHDAAAVAASTATVTLSHAVPLASALQIVTSEPVTELRLDGKNFGGAVLLSPTTVDNTNATLMAAASLKAESGAIPVAVGFEAKGASAKEVQRIQRRLEALEQATPTKMRKDTKATPHPELSVRADRLSSPRTAADSGTPSDPDVVWPVTDYTLDNFENA